MTQRIMVVDDSLLLREILKNMLTINGYDILEVDCGVKAISSYYEYKPDLVLLDINLPDMNGFAVMNILLEINPYAYIIIMTGHSKPEYFQPGLKGAKDFIYKPFNKSRILEAIKKGLSRSRLLFNDQN